MDETHSRPRPAPPRRNRQQMRWVYYRRRAVVGGGALLVLWLVARTVVGLAGWVAGGEDEPAAAAVPVGGDGEQAAAAPSTTVAPTCPPGGTSVPPGGTAPPTALTDALDVALANRSLTIRSTGVAVWVEGYGQLVDHQATEPLIPASNQKILTAMGVLELLDPDQRLDTEIRATGPVTPDGVVQGDLILVGGGDPLIKRTGPHSLEDLASQLAEAGITAVEGDVLGDESRYDEVRKAPGWLSWEMPLPGGAMSALMVNSNSRLGDEVYLADPTQHNAELFLASLETAGIEVGGTAGEGVAPEGSEVVHVYESLTVAELVGVMLRESDNMTAEMLTKEVGLQVAGEPSSTAGMEAMVAALEESLCTEIGGVDDDASGISRDDRRAPQDWMAMLLAARDAPWFDTFRESLPVAGEEGGTLATRFLGTSAVGEVAAKTGTTGQAVALSGYAVTEGGREVVFSVVVNGDQPEPAVAAMDGVVITIQADQS